LAVLREPLEGALDELALVDHHCHSVTAADLDRAGFEGLLTEAREPAPGCSSFDSAVGRWCGPLLDLQPHAAPGDYLARRLELGAREVNRRMLRAAGCGDLLVDGGYRSGELLAPADLAEPSGGRVHEVLRLETLAESVAAATTDPHDFAGAFSAALEDGARRAVAVKSVVAYRHGFGFDPGPPGEAEVAAAAAAWWEGARATGSWRLTDPVLLRHVLWAGAGLGRPLQLHAGFGDPDLRLHRADPALLGEWLEAVAPTGSTVMLLHCWPFHRQAAWLAAVYPHVYFDVGLALNYAGPRAAVVLGEAMEVAPFGKLLYSSDAFGLAELHYLGAVRFRRAMAAVLGEWAGAGEMALEDAAALASAVGAGNALRVYRLHQPVPGA
jgi:predicted TIM-barrel fold metal-dependent hydrolase